MKSRVFLWSLLWLGCLSCQATTEDSQCIIERRGANRSVVAVSGDCGDKNFAGIDLTDANTSNVDWGDAICPDGTRATDNGGTCQGHLDPNNRPEDAGQDQTPEDELALEQDQDLDTPQDLPTDTTQEDERTMEDVADVSEDEPDLPLNPCIGFVCPAHSTCASMVDLPSCTCDEGWEEDQGACININECLMSETCADLAICTDTEGSFTCACPQGFAGDPKVACRSLSCRAIRFDGVIGLATLPPGILESPPWTIEMWILPVDESPGGAILFLREGDDWLEIGSNQADLFYSSQGTEMALTAFSSSSYSFYLNEWVHLAFQMPGHQMFVNGREVYESPENSQPPWPTFLGNGEITLGGYDYGSELIGGFYTGLMSNVRFSYGKRYSEDFTPVRNLEVDQSTIALWPMDAYEGERVRDISGHSHHARLTFGTQRVECP